MIFYMYICFNIFRSSKFKIRSWVAFYVGSFSKFSRSKLGRLKLSPFWSWVLFEVKSFEVGSFEVESFEVGSSKLGRSKFSRSKFSRWIRDHDVVLVRRTIDLGCWEFGVGRERGGNGEGEVSSRATWGQGGRDRTTQKEGFQVRKREWKGNWQRNGQGE